jgi:hypothetical protein
MKAHDAEHAPYDEAALEDEGSAYDEEQETEAFHDPSVEDAGSIAATAAVTPARFYARLRTELSRRGVLYEQLPKFTEEGDAPPCFEEFRVPFDAWLSSASLLGATVPYRYDMPAEPNYCWDCTPAFKRDATAAGKCLFPNTRFEKTQTVIRDEQKKIIEVEVVGISRSKQAVIAEAQLQSLLPEEV